MSISEQGINHTEPNPSAALGCIRWLTMHIPPIPHASGLSNRIVKPIWCRFSQQPVVLNVWGETRMLLHPVDTLGGNLIFIPHLWDRWERQYVQECLKPGSVFVDVGSNIGAYALWAARIVGSNGSVIAIEPDPLILDVLKNNIALNAFESVISVCHLGVSDREEILRIERPIPGNMGITKLVPEGQGGGAQIACRTLASILKSVGVSQIDMLKIDIEGSELKVLREFFRETESESSLRPTHLLIEFDEGPLSATEKQSLAELVQSNQYELVHTGANAIFRKM